MAATADSRPHRLETLFDGMADCESEDSKVSVGQLMDALSHRSFGPLLLLPALISVLPVVGALPGVTWTTSAVCLIISLHFLFQRQRVWLPNFLRDLKMAQSSFCTGLGKAKPWLKKIDGVTHRRFHLMLGAPMPFLIALLCVILSLAMFVFSLVPGGVVIPAAGLILLSIGLTTHDGLLLGLGITIGIASMAGAVWLVFRFIV